MNAALALDAPQQQEILQLGPTMDWTPEIYAEQCSGRVLPTICHIGIRRPPHLTAQAALAQLRQSQPDIISGFDRAAIAAAEYFVECINKSGSYAEMN